MEANDVKRLKELEEENAKLKKCLQKSAYEGAFCKKRVGSG